jgi:hypothetical protein
MGITARIRIVLVAVSASALAAGTAQAVPQLTPTATTLAHTVYSGEAGVVWTTEGLSVNGQVVYDGISSLAIGGHITTLNSYDSLNGACPTDVGSNCSFGYGPPLDFTVLADYIGHTVTPQGGGSGLFDIVLEFQSTGGSDIVWTDPADGNSVMLSANWTAGSFMGSPTPGLQVVSTYCDGIGVCGAAGLTGDPLAIGFALLDNSTLYAAMFDSDGNPLTTNSIMLDFSELFDFNSVAAPGGIDAIAAYLVATNTLADFTGEGEGQLYRLETGAFVIPEPSTVMLLGLGIAGFGAVRRGKKR